MSDVPRTILAGELSSEHRGHYFRSYTYRDANKTSRPGQRLATFQADTIHHLKNGAILVNGSHPYLRPDTVLTFWDPVADAPELVHDGVWTTEAELDALPLLAMIMNPDGNPHAYQKRNLLFNGRYEQRWFCTTDSDWGDTSAQLLRDGNSFITLWLPKG
ncbi:hypothetical protein [Paenarthrobacter sp. C1]|uniref:hypothetical protein n=1 Tax=Paenarthrobacter sp. C1 TaxID=3400220 RepID=UPI003BF52B07